MRFVSIAATLSLSQCLFVPARPADWQLWRPMKSGLMKVQFASSAPSHSYCTKEKRLRLDPDVAVHLLCGLAAIRLQTFWKGMQAGAAMMSGAAFKAIPTAARPMAASHTCWQALSILECCSFVRHQATRCPKLPTEQCIKTQAFNRFAAQASNLIVLSL